jgi:hypothetical protein
VSFVCDPAGDQETAMSAPEVPAGQDRPDAPPDASGAITDRDARILDFEREWWKFAGAKEQAVRERFDVSPTRYYQLLNRVIDDEAALAYDPMLVKRLRRLRAQRQRQRAARRLGADAR